jgi:DNA-binding Lrp family transcriptional regulator
LSIPSADEVFDNIHRIMSVLDGENIKIISAMKKFGPRNLQHISRKSKVPYPTVYTRVNKLESEKLLATWVYPNYSKIGMARAILLVTPAHGRELLAREALKIPGYWIRVIRCSGECNGFYSVHAVPTDYKQDFEHYAEQLVTSGLVSDYKILWLGEFTSNIPNFEYFDSKKKAWKFNWPLWLKMFVDQAPSPKLEQAESQKTSFDKNDLLILKELNKDARTKLSEFAKLIGITLPAAKYRFDNLVRKGLVNDWVINILPYPPETSDLIEVRLDFRDENLLVANEKILYRLPFVLDWSRVRASNSITTRMFLQRSEVNNLITLLSALVRRNVLERFSMLTLDPMTIECQTFSYEYFTDGSGWRYDNREYISTLRKLVASFEKQELQAPAFTQIGPMQTLI